jgi:hypothetical protein
MLTWIIHQNQLSIIPTTFCKSTRHHGEFVPQYGVCAHEPLKKSVFLLPSTALLAGASFDVADWLASLSRARLIKLSSGRNENNFIFPLFNIYSLYSIKCAANIFQIELYWHKFIKHAQSLLKHNVYLKLTSFFVDVDLVSS